MASAERLREERRIRDVFVKQRLARPANPDESKDLTDFFHGEQADILECDACSLLVRDEHEPPPAQAYEEDDYNPRVMESQFPNYVDAFRRKESCYRELLPDGAKVLEVGSHYGAFLQVAYEWGWQAEGLDVGKDTSRFARSKGFTVHNAGLEQCQFADSTFDGVFIWNCFEQIEDPAPTLEACRRILRPGGLLTVRTPNGLFYSVCQTLLRDTDLRQGAQEFLIEAMGYNNLLGFPYFYGYSRATLERLIAPRGFQTEGVLNSELLTLPIPEKSSAIAKEEREINHEMRLVADSLIVDVQGAIAGPWIEVWFRAG